MNLHAIARRHVSSVNPEEKLLWYAALEQTADFLGRMTPAYADPVAVSGQVQSESDAGLFYSDRVAQNSETRNVYLLAPQGAKPEGLSRLEARGGDMIRRLVDGTWWLVNSVKEDFSVTSGWVCVQVTLQMNPPEGIE